MRESSTTRALITKRQPIAASTCLYREVMKKLNLDFSQLTASSENFLCSKKRALGRSWDSPPVDLCTETLAVLLGRPAVVVLLHEGALRRDSRIVRRYY